MVLIWPNLKMSFYQCQPANRKNAAENFLVIGFFPLYAAS
jgi:hypothetical protein